MEFGEIVGQHDRPGSHRDKLDARVNLGDFRVGHGRVAGAEVDEVFRGELRALADEAFDARPAAHRIVGDGQFRMRVLVGEEPLFIQRRGERGAGASQKGAARRGFDPGPRRVQSRTGCAARQKGGEGPDP
jgi:hypothetical protein